MSSKPTYSGLKPGETVVLGINNGQNFFFKLIAGSEEKYTAAYAFEKDGKEVVRTVSGPLSLYYRFQQRAKLGRFDFQGGPDRPGCMVIEPEAPSDPPPGKGKKALGSRVVLDLKGDEEFYLQLVRTLDSRYTALFSIKSQELTHSTLECAGPFDVFFEKAHGWEQLSLGGAQDSQKPGANDPGMVIEPDAPSDPPPPGEDQEGDQ